MRSLTPVSQQKGQKRKGLIKKKRNKMKGLPSGPMSFPTVLLSTGVSMLAVQMVVGRTWNDRHQYHLMCSKERETAE